jgi:hypothetical protein
MKELKETHGKVEGAPTTLEQIWGFNELAKYGTLDEAKYKEQVDEMNRTDLETHARRVGVVIVESSIRLKENLLKEFKNYVFYLRKPATQAKTQPELSKEVKKILSEGR